MIVSVEKAVGTEAVGVLWADCARGEVMISVASPGVFVWNCRLGAPSYVPLLVSPEMPVRAQFFPDSDGVLLVAGDGVVERVARLDQTLQAARWIAVAACRQVVAVGGQRAVTDRGERIDFGTALSSSAPLLPVTTSGLAVSADGEYIATADAVVATATGRVVRALGRDGQADQTGQDRCELAVFSGSSAFVATTGAGGVALHDLRSDDTRRLGDGRAEALAFAPDGRLLAVAAGGIHVWNVQGPHGVERMVFPMASPVSQLMFVTERFLLAVSDDEAHIFDVIRRQLAAVLTFGSDGNWLARSPDGHWDGHWNGQLPVGARRPRWLAKAMRLCR